MAEFRMPSLGADMESGTVLEWRVKPGDEVHRGDIVAVVDTDKADIDVEIFETGVIDELLVPVGERVAVGTPLATVRSGASSTSEATVAPAPEPAPPRPPADRPQLVVAAVAAHVDEDGHLHSPVLRRLAHHLDVDLATVTGTGANGRITRDDVERTAQRSAAGAGPALAAVAPAAPAPLASAPTGAAVREAPDRSSTMRRAIAGLMARSNREIPHYYVATDVDLEAALTWLARTNEDRPVTDRLLPAALLLKATALAARRVPQLNGFWIDDELRPSDRVHLGVAVSLREGGLVAPALHDADTKDLDTLMRELRDLVQRARTGHLRSSEMSDPTITVTNLGDQGVDEVLGVIYPPQVALVGVGRIGERPVAVAGMVGARPVVRITLAGDHRATDGHLGARFLTTIDKLLQQPEDLWTPASP